MFSINNENKLNQLCDTITSVDDSTSHVALGQSDILGGVLGGLANLRVEGQSGLHTDKQTLDVECLEHDLSHLLSIFRGVHWWFSKNKFMLRWLAS